MWLQEHEQCLIWSWSSNSALSSFDAGCSSAPPPTLLPTRQIGRQGNILLLPPLPYGCWWGWWFWCLAGDLSRSGTSSASNIPEASRSMASKACKSHWPELIMLHSHIQRFILLLLLLYTPQSSPNEQRQHHHYSAIIVGPRDVVVGVPWI